MASELTAEDLDRLRRLYDYWQQSASTRSLTLDEASVNALPALLEAAAAGLAAQEALARVDVVAQRSPQGFTGSGMGALFDAGMQAAAESLLAELRAALVAAREETR